MKTPWGEIRVEKVGRKLAIHCHYSRGLTAEIKAMRGAKAVFDDNEKFSHWEVSDCRRNWIQFECLQGQWPKEFKPYRRAPRSVSATRPLRKHQYTMLSHLLTRERCILAAEQGVGKSLTAIEGLSQCGGKWLWVAPAKVLRAIELELEKWHAPEVDLMSYAALRTAGQRDLQYDGIVFDESSRLKNAGTQQYKGAAALAKEATWVWCLSGRPAPQNPKDWWAQAELCCPGWLRESTAAKLESRCAILEERGEFTKIIGWKEDEVEKLGRRLRGLVLVVRSRDVQDLPPIDFRRVRLEVNPLTREIARAAARQSESPLMTLRQISDGFRYLGGEVKRVGGPKEQALREILWSCEERGRVVVFAPFRESVDRCVDICVEEGWMVLRCDGRGFKPPAGLDVKTMLKEMDRGHTHALDKVAFVGHPRSGGMGLTLTAAEDLVFFSNDFSLESRDQAIKRIHREGTENKVRVWDLLHLETDEYVLDRLEQNLSVSNVTLEEILNALQ